jgi:hypothetical protein
MQTRHTTHAEAVYVARSLNLPIETVWGILKSVPFSSHVELELIVHAHMDRAVTTKIESDFPVPSSLD